MQVVTNAVVRTGGAVACWRGIEALSEVEAARRQADDYPFTMG